MIQVLTIARLTILEASRRKLLLALGVFLGFWWGRECTIRRWQIRPEDERLSPGATRGER